MKKSILILPIIFAIFNLQAQDYLINFTGTGASSNVETVTIENLTQGKSITISGSQTLHLVETATSVTPMLEYLDYPLIIYPNPSSGDLTIQFDAPKSGSCYVIINDMAGREIKRHKQKVQNGLQSFKVQGLSNGVYTIQIVLEDKKFAKKVICNGRSNSIPTIYYNRSVVVRQETNTLKNAITEQAWQYSTGDRLKFKGTSGIYNTIVMDVPTESKTLSFEFIECTDGDGNNYPIVKIGDQWWMAENLKTTKYNDGKEIPNVTDHNEWYNLTIGAYCWHSNDINNKETKGALYNGHAVRTTHLAPKGWHIAKNEEWEELISYAGGNHVASIKLKETGDAHWLSEFANGTDEYGFAVLPGGIRNRPNDPDQNSAANWYTESENDNLTNLTVSLNGFLNDGDFFIGNTEIQVGLSVRCILKSQPVLSTNTVSNITYESAESGGLITSDGNSPIDSCGICWSINPHPTISDIISIDSLVDGEFKSKLSNLYFGTKYYVRAYAINDYGVGYGNELSFKTPDATDSISSIVVKLSSDSVQMGSSISAKCEALDQNGKVILGNMPAQWSSSNSKFAEINANGVITTEYDGEVYIKARYNDFIDSAKLIVTPDFNNWKAFFEPVPDAFPDLNSYYEELSENVISNVLTKVDLNKDGKTDLVFHLWHFRTEDEVLSLPIDAPVPNRLVALVSKDNGILKDQTIEIFGTSEVDLAGGASSVSVTEDLNLDGYPDWLYAMQREDGRPMGEGGFYPTQSVAVLSGENGTYHIVPFGDYGANYSIEVLPMYSGKNHILLGNQEYLFSNGTFIKITTSPNYNNIRLIYNSEYNIIPNSLLVSISHPSYLEQLKLFKRTEYQQNWVEEAVFSFTDFREVELIQNRFGGTDTIAIPLININGYEVIAGYFGESVALHLYPNTAPIPIVKYGASYIEGGVEEGQTLIPAELEKPCIALMAFESKDGVLHEKNIISDPLGFYESHTLDALDVNNDEYEDLITYPFGYDAKPKVFLNNHEGKLELLNGNRFPDNNFEIYGYTSTFADIDGDGIYDLVIWNGNGTGSHQFLLYKGRRNLQ